MNDGFNKMKELLLSDEEFRGKLKAAYEAYKGDQTDESVFNEVLVPLAAEYGITATYDEYKEYIRSVPDDEELSPEELDQVAGGDKMKGFGGAVCIGCGLGIGGGGNGDNCFGCLIIGGGGVAAGCAWEGASETIIEHK